MNKKQELNKLKVLLEDFKRTLEDVGWDMTIDILNIILNIRKNNVLIPEYYELLYKLVELYRLSYNFDTNNIDGDMGGFIRQSVVNIILDIENDLWR